MGHKFNKAIKTVLEHEGGYVHDPDDPGGETNFGISKKSHPEVDIKGLTEDSAKIIYLKYYWEPNRYDLIHRVATSTKIFDLAVNMGPANAHKAVQRALRACGEPDIKADGILGPKTLKALNETMPDPLLACIRSEAASHYRLLIAQRPELKKFKKGWLERAYA